MGERRASGLCTSAPYWAGGQTETLGPLPKYRDLDCVGYVGYSHFVGASRRSGARYLVLGLGRGEQSG